MLKLNKYEIFQIMILGFTFIVIKNSRAFVFSNQWGIKSNGIKTKADFIDLFYLIYE